MLPVLFQVEEARSDGVKLSALGSQALRRAHTTCNNNNVLCRVTNGWGCRKSPRLTDGGLPPARNVRKEQALGASLFRIAHEQSSQHSASSHVRCSRAAGDKINNSRGFTTSAGVTEQCR